MTKQTFSQFPDTMWVTAVQVATVWTEPSSAREVDQFGTTNPTNIDAWIDGMSYEENLALCEEKRVQTQLLFGEPVLVTEIEGLWAHVVIPSQPSNKDERGYPGWVPLNQLKQVQKSDWEQEQTAAVITDKAWLENENKEKVMKLSYMTFLPIQEIHEGRVEVITPLGNHYLQENSVEIFQSKEGLKKGTGSDIVKSGEPYLSLEYFWGGMSTFGYDCSGLSYNAHKANGYKIARDAGDQAKGGKEIAFDEAKPGDLVFFAYEEGKGRIYHVGIYYGNGKMLHAPQNGEGVEITTLEGTKYGRERCAVRRYWES
jgi:cell wall-associated NlpC family hydrolase